MFYDEVALVFFQCHFALNKQFMVGQRVGIRRDALFTIKAFGLRSPPEHFVGRNLACPLHGLLSPLIRMHGIASR